MHQHRHRRVAPGDPSRATRAVGAQVQSPQVPVMGTGTLLDLQRLAGNRAVGRLAARARAGGGPPSAPPQPTGATVQRQGGSGGATKALAQIQTMKLPQLDHWITAGRATVLRYLTHGFGVGGTRRWRSTEVRKFRGAMKERAREQTRRDIGTALQTEQAGEATKGYVEIAARHEAYTAAKGSVDRALTDDAEAWLSKNWDPAAIRVGAQKAARTAMQQATDPKGPTTAPKTATRRVEAAGRRAARAHINDQVKRSLEEARKWKNSFVKPTKQRDTTGSTTGEDLGQHVIERVQAERLGEKTVSRIIKAQTTDDGLSVIGRLLDEVVPQAGDTVSLSIELQIPIPESPAFVSLKFAGKAGRGIDGFTTAGVPTLGNPHRLEVMGEFRVGTGAELLGVKADLSVGFFVRGGANSTASAMRAINYAAYRAATGHSSALGRWWAGGGKGTGESTLVRAESWAAMIEELAFAEGGGAFADLGASFGGGAQVDYSVVKGGLKGGFSAFQHYDRQTLSAALGEERFAKALANADRVKAAKERQKRAKGAAGASWGVEATAEVQILDQGVEFTASASGSLTKARDNWGVEVTAAISSAFVSIPTIGKVATGVAGGILSVMKALSAAGEKQKAVGPTAEVGGDVARIVNAGLDDQIAEMLRGLWSKGEDPGLDPVSKLQLAFLFGKSGGEVVWRIELRESKGGTVKVGIGSVGVTVEVHRTKRLAAVGYESGKVQGEVAGLRVPRTTKAAQA